MNRNGKPGFRILIGAALLSGCAGPIYLHSPSLATTTATAADSLPPEAAAIGNLIDAIHGLVASYAAGAT